MKLSSLNMLMYELNDKVYGLMKGLLCMCGDYGVSHVHCTSRLRLGSWTKSNNDVCEVKSLYVQIDVSYCKDNRVST